MPIRNPQWQLSMYFSSQDSYLRGIKGYGIPLNVIAKSTDLITLSRFAFFMRPAFKDGSHTMTCLAHLCSRSLATFYSP